MIICITGMPGAGKTVAAEIFAENGFALEEMGDEVRREAKLSGSPVDGPAFWDFAAAFKARHGMAVIAERIAGRTESDADVVISGLRNTGELDVFRKKFGNSLMVLEIYAPPEIRYQRLLGRNKVHQMKDYEEFLGRERNELEGLGQASIQGIADVRIDNVGSVDDLGQKIHDFLGKVTQKPKTVKH